MQQDISTEPVVVVLKRILADSLSGELKVKGKEFEKSLYFMDGVLVAARSTRLDERIGVVLYMIGKISEELYDSISGLVHSIDREVGDILVQNNFVGKQDLYSARMYLTRRIALSTFALEEGTWELDEQIPNIPENEKCIIQLPAIIVEGTRKNQNISYFKNKIYFHSPRPAAPIPESLAPLLTNEEKIFFRELEECTDLTNREIISKLNLHPDFYWEKIILFLMLDLVEFTEHPPDEDVAENLEILLKLNEELQTRLKDPHEVLGVSPSASIEEVEHVFQTKSHFFHPGKFGSAAAPEVKNIARFVLGKLEDAYRALLHKAREDTTPPLDVTPVGKESPRTKAKLLFSRAEILHREGNFQEAANLLKEAVKLDPGKGKYFHLLGLCQSEIIFFHGDAERNLKKAVELEPWDAEPVYSLGLLFRKQQKLKLSEKCFQRALEIDRSFQEAGKAIAELHHRDKDRKGSFFTIFKPKT